MKWWGAIWFDTRKGFHDWVQEVCRSSWHSCDLVSLFLDSSALLDDLPTNGIHLGAHSFDGVDGFCGLLWLGHGVLGFLDTRFWGCRWF